ncbi:SPOR domain-containing protein [Pseudomonas sp. PDM14]|uniref:SPOR domain-containing protein n=1 Tax=Pseudomonas sp. PDM14 TaxID=2769288 RepID=UPI00177FFAA7|nr:SPOR domain-containing protein [Pseudomonas sp. PDM14]MBD9482823.1 SPOR domain-containing protein [Pseudomonas sp. PDM14]
MTSLHADEAYLAHHQFSHDPFAARVPGFRFFPAQRKPVLGQLHHLARYSQLLLVVTGPLGSGKTLLRQALVASTNKQAVLSVVISARGASDVAGVLRQVALGLGIQQLDMRSILAHVAQLALTGQEVYLLVDDAEQLADAALDALFTLAAGTAEARPHVFLFADSELLPRLELLADGEERFHAIELQPYSEDETREYLAQRLDGAGQGIELLSDDQVSDIHLSSGGWPGSINQAARDVLIESMLAQRGAAGGSGGSLGLPKKHVLAVAVVLLALGAAWFMQGRKSTGIDIPASTQVVPQEAAPATAAAPARPAESAPAQNAAIEFSGSSQPLPLPLVGEAQPVIREPLAQASGMAEGEEGGEAEGLAPLPSVAPVAPPVVVAPAVVPPVATVTAPAAKPETPVAAAPKPAPAVKLAPVTTPAPVATKPVPQPAPAAKPAAPVVAKVSSGNGWYASQSGSHFALQILGTRSESSAKAFVAKNGGEYHYFQKLHQGKPLYVVTYGKFSTRGAAQAAIKSLPASVQAGKPWPRSFASIQQEASAGR